MIKSQFEQKLEYNKNKYNKIGRRKKIKKKKQTRYCIKL